jgi:hypothetical protein
MFNPAAGSGSQSDIDYVFGYEPMAMAVDSHGNLFEFGWDWENDSGTIYEFPWNGVPGIFVSGLNYPYGLAIDANGDLFASDQSGCIFEFANNGGVLSANLFETEEDSGKLNEFINTGGTLSSTPVTFATGLGTAAGLAIYLSPDVRQNWFQFTTGGAPQINIAAMSLSTPASLVISWPATATGNGYVVQTNGDLTTSNWADYGGTVNSDQGTNSVTITPTSGNLFFRLKRP